MNLTLKAPLWRQTGRKQDGQTHSVRKLHTCMFEPSIGLIPQARNWSEYERGSVKLRLEQAELLPALPGEEGCISHRELVMNMFGASFGTTPIEQLTPESMFTPGLPLDHSKRIIWFQRFRKQGTVDLAALSAAVEEMKCNLPQNLRSLPVQELTCSEVEGILGPIAEVAFSWNPPFEVGSLEVVQEYAPTIANMFDKLLPRLQATDFDNRDTLAVLKFDGELYFEGDDPWGIRSRDESAPMP